MVATYTPDELSTIAAAPMLVGLAVAMVDMGIISTAIEAAAMSSQIASAAKNYPSNSIIQAVFSEAAFKSKAVKLEKPDMPPEAVQSGAVVDTAIAAIQSALGVLAGKATDAEIQEYKTFIYQCADAVANAAGSGLFGTGTKVSPEEAAALTKLKTVLEI